MIKRENENHSRNSYSFTTAKLYEPRTLNPKQRYITENSTSFTFAQKFSAYFRFPDAVKIKFFGM